ncbi:MAG TPA: hypothetical protein VK168_04745, partial [Saprospiraceae bacterium]|nr:hypothetical protein [Saprospiraceae bacterium]
QKLSFFRHFSPFFSHVPSTRDASSKTQKLTKKAQIFDSVRKSPTCSNKSDQSFIVDIKTHSLWNFLALAPG